jgi:hypothetical protein
VLRGFIAQRPATERSEVERRVGRHGPTTFAAIASSTARLGKFFSAVTASPTDTYSKPLLGTSYISLARTNSAYSPASRILAEDGRESYDFFRLCPNCFFTSARDCDSKCFALSPNSMARQTRKYGTGLYSDTARNVRSQSR